MTLFVSTHALKVLPVSCLLDDSVLLFIPRNDSVHFKTYLL